MRKNTYFALSPSFWRCLLVNFIYLHLFVLLCAVIFGVAMLYYDPIVWESNITNDTPSIIGYVLVFGVWLGCEFTAVPLFSIFVYGLLSVEFHNGILSFPGTTEKVADVQSVKSRGLICIVSFGWMKSTLLPGPWLLSKRTQQDFHTYLVQEFGDDHSLTKIYQLADANRN